MSPPRLAWACLHMLGGSSIEINPHHVSAVRDTREGTFVFLLGRGKPIIVEHSAEDVLVELQEAVEAAQ
jgi:hypothetical protein